MLILHTADFENEEKQLEHTAMKDDLTDIQLTRKERERLFRRQEIITAAREVFAARGFNDATLDEIAEKAEFGKGTLYNYFQSKDELFDAVVLSGYESILSTATEVIAEPGRDMRSAFLETARTLLRLLMENAGVFMIMMREFHKPITQNKLAEHYPRLVSIMEAPLKLGIERGEFRDCDTEEVAAAFINSIFSGFKFRLMKRYLCCLDIDETVIPTFEEHEYVTEIDRIIAMLDATFFLGILHENNRRI